MMRVTWMAAIVCAAVAVPASAQVDDEAKKVLNESAAAIQKVEGVEYEVKTSATGMLKDIIDLSGKVKIWHPPGASTITWRVDGRAKNPGKGDQKLVVVSDGVTVRWLDDETHQVIEQPISDSAAMERVNLCRELMPSEWTSPTPYQVELTNFPILTKGAIINFGGEICDVITAMPATRDRSRVWAISVKDRLPRQLELATGNAAGKISKITEMTEMKAREFTKKDFEIAAGDFAPKVDTPPASPTTTPAAPLAPVQAAPDAARNPPRAADAQTTGTTSGDAGGATMPWLLVVLGLIGAVVAALVVKRLLAHK